MSFPSMPHTPRAPAVSQKADRVVDTHLYGRRLVLARSLWIILVLLTLTCFSLLFPGYVAVETSQMAQAFHFSGGSSLIVTLTLNITTLGIALAVALVIFWHKSDDWMALLSGLMLTMLGTTYITATLMQSHSPERGPALLLSSVTYGVFFLVFCLFPDGRFVPRWSGWLPILWLTWSTIFSILYLFVGIPFFIHHLVWLGALICLIMAQLYRYRYVSSPVQRQQTKWVVLGVVLAIGMIFTIVLLLLVFPSLISSGLGYYLLDVVGYTFALLFGTISFAIAILRSRLYNIDIIINRTLVYGTLTVLLALVYFGLVVALQLLLRGILNQTNDLAIVIATLAIAALFQPLRRRIQQGIDRRFYRRKYDAARTLAAFSATLRNQVDLDQLREELLAVTQETMQPSHISLWLRPPEQGSTKQATWSSPAPATQDGEEQ
jgi:hypothetical protein